MDKKAMQVNHLTHKTFDYRKGNVSLNVSLRTDIKQDMKDFLEIIKLLDSDVRKELEKKDKEK